MRLTADVLARMAGQSVSTGNIRSAMAGLERFGTGAGLDRPHRLAHFLAQVGHESNWWRYDQELWGPTAAQKRYEGRKDLGNVKPGDGYRFRGRGPIQITGRSNYHQFTQWARRMDARAPDFTSDPDAVNTDPWEGLVPIWYWETRDLNGLADANDARGITRKINGGLNGFDDRLNRYTRAALVLLGYAPNGVKVFQTDAGLKADGIAGPATRAALHRKLMAAPLVSFGAAPAKPSTPTPAPTPDSVQRPVASVGIATAIIVALAAFFLLKG